MSGNKSLESSVLHKSPVLNGQDLGVWTKDISGFFMPLQNLHPSVNATEIIRRFMTHPSPIHKNVGANSPGRGN